MIKGTTKALTKKQLKRWNEIKDRTPGYKYKDSDWDIYEIVNFREGALGGTFKNGKHIMGTTKNTPPKQLKEYLIN
tara:strand:+ start:163 stop:390 length:228 start_codon:yes stop_codon:yes gene_type:complete